MRPSVDVVVPFAGNVAALSELVRRLKRLELTAGDTLTVVDNTRTGVRCGEVVAPIDIVRAPERQSAYHGRNRGAARGTADWLLFLDADVEAPHDLIDRYFDPPPGDRTAVLAGAVHDVSPARNGRESLAGRYARLRKLIDQANTLQMARPYAKTANCAVRRTAFEAVGGFTAAIRSGGDADLCFRLAEAGWQLDPRPDALATHRSRRGVIDLLGQRARHGSGAEWLEQRYPGSIGPRGRWRGAGKDAVLGVARALGCLARGDSDRAVVSLLDPASNTAFEVGRRVPNLPWREQPRVAWLVRLVDHRAR